MYLLDVDFRVGAMRAQLTKHLLEFQVEAKRIFLAGELHLLALFLDRFAHSLVQSIGLLYRLLVLFALGLDSARLPLYNALTRQSSARIMMDCPDCILAVIPDKIDHVFLADLPRFILALEYRRNLSDSYVNSTHALPSLATKDLHVKY